MCLAAFAWRAHPAFEFVLAANRDEFHDRPSRPAAFWDENPGVLAGRDLKGGGTWLGVTRGGRIALLTNFRDPKNVILEAPSRGQLVASFLTGRKSVEEFLEGLLPEADQYNGFNLVLGAGGEVWWFSNRSGEVRKLEPGIHGLSNALLDTPWPKVRRASDRLAQTLSNREAGTADLFHFLTDTAAAPDSDLPETGVGLDWERALSPPFIRTERYGTRNSTVVLIGNDGWCRFEERTYDRDPAAFSSIVHAFQLSILSEEKR